jgi:hypothetical protein
MELFDVTDSEDELPPVRNYFIIILYLKIVKISKIRKKYLKVETKYLIIGFS